MSWRAVGSIGQNQTHPNPSTDVLLSCLRRSHALSVESSGRVEAILTVRA